MATLFKTDGTQEKVTPADVKKGFTLDELYGLLDCETIEAVYLGAKGVMVVDEEGKIRLDRKPCNYKATDACKGKLQRHDEIVGPALLCSRKEFK